MNPIQIHLGLNHFPVVGLILFLPVFAYALWQRKTQLIKLSLIMFFILGLIAIVVHSSGENAEEIVEHQLSISHKQIHEHEEWGEKAYLVCALTGFLSVLILALRWSYESWKRWVYFSILLLGLISCSLMFITASSGGKIRHTELEQPGD